MELKDRLQTALDRSDLTSQQQLADAAHITRQSVNGWLSGDTKSIKPEHLFPVAEALGVSPKWLGTGIGSMIQQNNEYSESIAKNVFTLIADKIDKINDEFSDAPPSEKATYLSRFYSTALKKL